VNTGTAGILCIVLAQTVVIPDKVEIRLGAPENLASKAGLPVVPSVRLPAVDDPRLDL